MYLENEIDTEINENDCCGNGCTNCILDNKPKQSSKALLLGKRNIILNYTKFKLLHKQQTHDGANSNDVLELHFACAWPQNETQEYMLDIPPGHHVMMRILNNNATASKHLLRPYSPYWLNALNLEFKILVNLSPHGPMSNFISNMKTNDVVEFRGPIGNYKHDPNVAKNIFIIAQGVAIAPTIPIIEEILLNEDDINRIHHLVCCKDLKHVYFRERMHEFNTYWNYQCQVYLAHEQCSSAKCLQTGSCTSDCPEFLKALRYKENIIPNRLNLEQFQHAYNKISATLDGISFIVCGSVKFQQEILSFIRNSGIDMTKTRTHFL